jgi:hypothetical protein
VLFFGLLALPVLNSIFKFAEFERKDENRAFKDELTIDINTLDNFPAACDSFVNDNFSFRKPLLDFHSELKFSFFGISPHPDQTIVGYDGWYFLAGKEIDIFEGKLDFTDKQLNEYKLEWERRATYLENKNIKFHWLICPNKHSVYPDKLPFNVLQSKNGLRTAQLARYLNKSFPGLVIDPTSQLIAAKKSEKVFYQLDNHWNDKAGYITSKLLLSKINADFPDENIAFQGDFRWKDSTIRQGIHYDVIGRDELSETVKYMYNPDEKAEKGFVMKFPPPKGFAYPWEYERNFAKANDSTGKTILIIRDSFGQCLIPFIKESFSKSVFIFDAWKYRLNEHIIETVKPDIVIYITVETNLNAFIEASKF